MLTLCWFVMIVNNGAICANITSKTPCTVSPLVVILPIVYNVNVSGETPYSLDWVAPPILPAI